MEGSLTSICLVLIVENGEEQEGNAKGSFHEYGALYFPLLYYRHKFNEKS